MNLDAESFSTAQQAASAAFQRNARPEQELPGLTEFWQHWGFAPWAQGNLSGVARKQHFVKDGILGRIAEYDAWDYIVWSNGTHEEREALWNSVKPLPGVVTQRFLFLMEENPWGKRRLRAFRFGFKGFLEYYVYWPEPWEHPDDPVSSTKEPKDLTGLVRLGMRLAFTQKQPPA